MKEVCGSTSAKLIFSVAASVFVAVLAALYVSRFLPGSPLADATPVESSSPIIYGNGTGPFDFQEAANRILPTVVSINATIERDTFIPGRTVEQLSGSGSGVIVSADGYIVTNAHVVRDPSIKTRPKPADRVRVRTADGRGFTAEVVGIDQLSDLAVLKVEGNDLPSARFGDSSALDIGEWVIAIGNPLGYNNTLTAGVVSSKGRTIETSSGSLIIDSIQTDAAINRGNSGGALCNIQGEVVGINSAIPTQQSVGIGFAIPSNHVQRVVRDIQDYGYVRYGVPGMTFLDTWSLSIERDRQKVMSRVETEKEPPSYGLIVLSAHDDKPAKQAGIKPFDVIMEFDGKRLYRRNEFYAILAEKAPGDEVEFVVWSAGSTRTIKLTLAEL